MCYSKLARSVKASVRILRDHHTGNIEDVLDGYVPFYKGRKQWGNAAVEPEIRKLQLQRILQASHLLADHDVDINS